MNTLSDGRFEEEFDFLVSAVKTPDFPRGVVGLTSLNPVNAPYVFQLAQHSFDFLARNLSYPAAVFIQAVFKKHDFDAGIVFTESQRDRLEKAIGLIKKQ